MKDAWPEIVGYGLFLMCVMVALVTVQGCSPKLAEIRVTPPVSQACPTLALPAVPEDVVLDIKGSQVTANTGGETILRGYVQARSLLRPAHAK